MAAGTLSGPLMAINQRGHARAWNLAEKLQNVMAVTERPTINPLYGR